MTFRVVSRCAQYITALFWVVVWFACITVISCKVIVAFVTIRLSEISITRDAVCVGVCVARKTLLVSPIVTSIAALFVVSGVTKYVANSSGIIVGYADTVSITVTSATTLYVTAELAASNSRRIHDNRAL